MAHIRKPLAAAATLNAAIFLGEAWAGLRASSLSLLGDAVHNFSDQLALVCLLLAYLVTTRASRHFQRWANLLNSAGLLAISAVLVWQALERVLHPQPLIGWLPVAVGVFGVLGNWAVALLLRPWERHSPAIRLAYLHNLGDVYVSLAPIAAGALVIATGYPIFDPVLALAIGVWLVISTVHELRGSSGVLLWPQDATCPHPEGASH
jgi:cobalt-zinc-cadmium efflux system protein